MLSDVSCQVGSDRCDVVERIDDAIQMMMLDDGKMGRHIG